MIISFHYEVGSFPPELATQRFVIPHILLKRLCDTVSLFLSVLLHSLFCCIYTFSCDTDAVKKQT